MYKLKESEQHKNLCRISESLSHDGMIFLDFSNYVERTGLKEKLCSQDSAEKSVVIRLW